MPERAGAFAPGRVNLIGEHTDYNDGLALPFALTRGVTVRAQRLEAGSFEVHAHDFGERDAFTLASPGRGRGWRAYVRGTVSELAAELAASGIELCGARLEIRSTLPRGGGLSSSAALTVALTLALVALSGSPPLDRLRVARLCSRVEHRHVGTESGLLDQLAVLHGRVGHAVLIDFATLQLTPVPLSLHGHQIVLLGSGQSRELGAGGGGTSRALGAGDGGQSLAPSAPRSYNARRAECRRACALLGIDSLRAATPALAAGLPPPLDARARHVIGENARVRRAVDALRAGDLTGLGELLDASHASLREDYDVSTPALERAVGALKAAGALGARLTGGGFGGYALGLLPPGARPPAGAIAATPADGARLL